MMWVIIITMVVIFVPNVFKLFSVSAKLLRIMPSYLRWVGHDSTVLDDEDTRSRLRNSFTVIFFSLQTHVLNVVVCALITWLVWHGQLPPLSPWLKALVSIISIVAGVSNIIITHRLIKEFLQIQESERAIEQLHLHLGFRKDERSKSFTFADVVWVWAAIGMYIVSAVSCTGLAYFVWS